MHNGALQQSDGKTTRNVARQQAARLTGSPLEVASDVACLPLSLVNVYLVGDQYAGDREWVLVDAGVAFSAGEIVRAAAERFGPNARPAAIILTHGHFDHVGALPDVADRWEAPIYAHELEMPYLTGRSSYPPPDPAVGGGAMSLLSRFYPRGPIDLGSRVHTLPADGSVPGMRGWRWIHTPGHTAGHVSLFRDSDRVLIAGDAFVTQRQESALAVLTQRQEVRRPPAYYTTDWKSAHRSVEKLAELRPEVAATGHGVPMYGERMRGELDYLVRHWDRVATPTYGRYVDQPAVTDERGVVSVPPPVADPNLAKAITVGAAAAAGFLLLAGLSQTRRKR
jgi:glyoxylase-like metal-dependent hydrolase (beta-lactamase superfamily II)